MRHRHALARVKLEKVLISVKKSCTSKMFFLQDKTEVMSQLEIMEREDRARRQKALSSMPVSLIIHK